MRNKQRLLIMFLLIVTLFLYIVNNGHGLLYNPTFNKDTKTWSFEEIIKLAPQKLEDLFLLA